MNMNRGKSLSEIFQDQRSSLKFKPPGQLVAGIREGLEASVQDFKPVPWFKSWWFGMGSGFAIAGLIFFVLSFSAPRFQSPTELLDHEVVSLHVRSLMASHLMDVASTNQHTVKPWFEGRLDFAPNVKDFAEKGFPLIGGRLEYAGGRPIAALVYKHDLHIINVLQWPASSSGEDSPRFQEIRGYQIYHWQKAGMSYWAISDLNAVDLQKFTEVWISQ